MQWDTPIPGKTRLRCALLQTWDAPCGLRAELNLPKPIGPKALHGFQGRIFLIGSMWAALLTVAENSRTPR